MLRTWAKGIHLSQEKIVILISILLFVAFSVADRAFLKVGNILALLRDVSILGMLGIGMAITIIGRGIDLTIVATMAVSVAWALYLCQAGYSLEFALVIGLVLALCIGLTTGALIAYVRIPAVFATLAMGSVVYGFGRSKLINADVMYPPSQTGWIGWIGSGRLVGIPVPILVFAILCGLIASFLSYSKYGRFIYALGDNPHASQISGIPVKRVVLVQYAISSFVAFVAGLVMAMSVASMNVRIVNSTLLNNVILVAVLGGISLSGGVGGVRNVLWGTILIGIFVNGMTILDVQYQTQNMIKGSILLLAIVLDAVVNPRDEQISQQGDI
jgi:ribose transport system permease protein